MQLRLALSVLFLSLWTGLAEAQELTAVISSGSHSVLGSTVAQASKALPAGFAPVNDQVAFVYDVPFYFFMRSNGAGTDTSGDRRAAYRSFGYVVVAAAGNPGGNFTETPWITNDSFDASFVEGHVSTDYGYTTTFVPTLRGYQSYLIYTNLVRTSSPTSLPVYDDALRFGAGNYLLTGDGPEQGTELRFDSNQAAQGSRAISVKATQNTQGTHWKLMLFANGAAAGFDGVNLSAYDKLVFHAKASRNVVLRGAFGTGDDTGSVGFGVLDVGTSYQKFEIDLSKVNRADVNTLFWIYMHKADNNFNFKNVSVYFDGIELVGRTATSAVVVVDQQYDSLDGACTTDGSRTGTCNLRAAVDAAEGVSGPVSIAVTLPQSVTLGAINVPAGTNLGMVGTTADMTSVYGQGQDIAGQLFNVEAGATLALAELWVTNFSAWVGGAIVNQGNLTLDHVTVSDNTARCFGTGAMTSNANCWGGAIINSGKLVLRGGSAFHRNVVLASSSTASFTNATASGGVIANSGELLIDGPVAFANNSVDATATSGFHGTNVPNGAWASASGGAISHTGGSLTVTGGAVGHCSFSGNAALATAQAVSAPGTATSAGGAIWSQATLNIPSNACTFSENSAQTGADIHVAP